MVTLRLFLFSRLGGEAVNKSELVAVRLTPDELEKLERLAQDAQRTRSDVLRLLVKRADVSTLPDVKLAEDGEE